MLKELAISGFLALLTAAIYITSWLLCAPGSQYQPLARWMLFGTLFVALAASIVAYFKIEKE